ncbi:hypothetical protein UFOVP1616_40 [uncultured Caudovirales phage]|uniref:Glyco_tranf_GTA_type domain containing protein n=1 Tax=uncultured Caudovirales phage TaxID=2100421 RepID=A0A6J5SWN5_9CAUD|nr:hypothetical protein UFOVP1467_56 [uncultured Caudovirales phage]CAB4219659.1 hypothetical protein UFOVP1616_40 [uncultured Caudovirales phage]
MTNSNLLIIATRDRPHNAIRAFEQAMQMSTESDFLIIINEDQQDLYPEIEGVMREVVPSELGCIGKTNHVLASYWDKYETMVGFDDDCMVTTQGWDAVLAAPIKQRGFGLAYGDDLLQGENLPTKVMISTNITRVLGFWAPKSIFHLYADNFWKSLGQGLGALFYNPEVKTEHWHYLNGKAPQDDLYKSIYTAEAIKRDRDAYQAYMGDEFDKDIERLKQALG